MNYDSVKVVVTSMYVLLYCIDRVLWAVDLFSSEQSGPSTVNQIVLLISVLPGSLARLTTPITLIRRMFPYTSYLINEQLTIRTAQYPLYWHDKPRN
jgi:hypothetical protein